MDIDEDELERMLERAADKAVEKQRQKLYEETGRLAWKAFLYALGAAVLGVTAWLSSHGVK